MMCEQRNVRECDMKAEKPFPLSDLILTNIKINVRYIQ